jgi:phosphomannomutase
VLDPTVFKAYDIRGIFPNELDEAFAYALGQAFAVLTKNQNQENVVIGRDGRLSSHALSRALGMGLQAGGMQVLDIGMVTTPMLYFATATLYDNGIQVTGSHNPKDYNGFKLVLAGQALHGEQIREIKRLMESSPQWFNKPQSAHEDWGHIDIEPSYQNAVVQDITLRRPMKVVVDCGNGVAGASVPALLRLIGCEVIELFTEVDGHFPNHHPDPSQPANLQDLMQSVRTHQAELGLAFDGDGDRLGVVTHKGQIVYPDRQLMLFAQDVLHSRPHATIVFDIKCTQQLAGFIRAHGGVPLMHQTGHSLIKAKMREIDSPLGGEMSGHIFIKDRWFGFDDAAYAAARLLEIVSIQANASAVLEALPDSFSTPEIQIPCHDTAESFKLVSTLQVQIENAPSLTERFGPPAVITTIDGIRVDWPDGFGLIRASNTTPTIVTRFEGHTPEALTRIRHHMMELLYALKPEARYLQDSEENEDSVTP